MGNTSMHYTPKEVIAANLKFLMKLYQKTRKNVCFDLDIPYTTFCDWYHGKTYPRIDNLESMGRYFRVETRDFFIEIEKNPRLVQRLMSYVETVGVCRDCDIDAACNTVEDYNETPEGYPLELINGNFFVMESPTMRHQSIVMELSAEIRNYIKKKQGMCKVYPGPFDVELPTHKATVAVPDITVVCDRDKLNRTRCIGAPDWIIEIWSKSTWMRDANEKLIAYGEAGVKEYWMVDPWKNEVHVYQLDETRTSRNLEAPYYLPPQRYTFAEHVPSTTLDGFHICLEEMELDEEEK